MAKSNAQSTLPVSVRGEAVGDFARSVVARAGSTFRYHLSTSPSQAISLTMPARLESYDWKQGAHPIFQMHMPEGQLRAQLLTMFSKTITGFDDIDLLGIVGPHQLGRVTVGSLDHGELPDTSVRDLLLHDSARGLFEELLTQYAPYSGVSGVQPKFLLRDANTSFDRITHRGATHIVKSWGADFPELAANEFFCMRAARHAGLRVPDISLSAHGKFLIVERFDVAEEGFLGFEDLNVLNGWLPHQKYDGAYEGCARQLKAFLSPHRLAEGLEALFLTVALSAGVRNGDAHLKNFGVVYEDCSDEADVRIAPAYDIVSTAPYSPQDIMALQLAGSKNWPKHKLLVDFGRRSCQLTERRCRELLEQVGDGMAQARAELVEYQRHHASFEIIGAKMLGAWELGTARSLLPPDRTAHVDMGSGKR